jgi:gliding motility-associated-like protein
MKKNCILLVCFLFSGLHSIYSQSDCSNALPLCTDANSGGVVNSFGIDDFYGLSESGCLKNGLGVTTVETNSYWFRIKMASSGQFGFNIIPNNLTEDWDFAVYGPNATCGALSDPIACNYSKVSATGYTGVGTDPNSNTKTVAYDDWMTVAAGEEYVILVNQYAGNNAGFSIIWQGAVVDNNSDYLDCSIVVNLGPDQEYCEGKETTLYATTFGVDISYEWFIFNTALGIYESIPGETGDTLTVTTTGNYKVEVTDNAIPITKSSDVNVTFYDVPIANDVKDLPECDEDRDGIANFNLELQSGGIIDGQMGMTVTYYESEALALSNLSQLSSPYSSGAKTIWARIENSAPVGCFDITSFELIPVEFPTATPPPNLYLCDDDNDGKMIFNLDNQTPIVLNGQVGVVTYYDDEANANDRKGWLLNTLAYESGTETIWVRVEPSPNSDCYAITSFELVVLESALANPITEILQCDDNNDGLYQFDLNTLKDAEVLVDQDPSIFEVIYFSSQLNADNNTNPLSMPYTNVTPYAIETLYARIHNRGLVDCYDTTSFTLQVFDSAKPPIPSELADLSYCDDDTDGDDTNGYFQFDLREREAEILNGQSPFVFEVSYYEDDGYQNQISNPSAFTNAISGYQTIYVRVRNSNPNNITCFTDTSFNIEVRPLPYAMLTPFELLQCDGDGTPDGITDFNLEQADTYLALGDSSLLVSYHLTMVDAASSTNPQDKWPFSNFTSSSIFARVQSQVNGCYRIVPVDLVVATTSFPPDYFREIVACDDDGSNDGVYAFNLGLTTSEIIAQFQVQNLRVSYFRNRDDALVENNAINSTTTYLNETAYSQTIWVRVESSNDGSCFAIAPVIELTVNAIPEFDVDETDIVCLNNTPLQVSVYNESGIYSYQWWNDQGILVSQASDANIYEAGVYTVVATSNQGCESVPRTIIIEASSIASLDSNDIQISEDTHNNNITVLTGNLGIGDYEFALDDINGFYQDDPTFDQVAPGQHTVFVREKNGCGIAQVTIFVFGFPKFFTPNNDGHNDRWNVLGIDASIFTDSFIYIYDRYGKLIANFSAFDLGWDGMYNDNEAISSDYWYAAQMVHIDGNIREYRGHFSLIRR